MTWKHTGNRRVSNQGGCSVVAFGTKGSTTEGKHDDGSTIVGLQHASLAHAWLLVSSIVACGALMGPRLDGCVRGQTTPHPPLIRLDFTKRQPQPPLKNRNLGGGGLTVFQRRNWISATQTLQLLTTKTAADRTNKTCVKSARPPFALLLECTRNAKQLLQCN